MSEELQLAVPAACMLPRCLTAAALHFLWTLCSGEQKKKEREKRKNSRRELQPPKVEVVALGQLYSRKPLKKKKMMICRSCAECKRG